MLAAFSDANFARIPHAAHFISAAALVRVGLDPLSWKKEKKKQSINCCSVRGGGCFSLVQHTNHKSKTKQHENNLVGEHYTFHRSKITNFHEYTFFIAMSDRDTSEYWLRLHFTWTNFSFNDFFPFWFYVRSWKLFMLNELSLLLLYNNRSP